MGAAKFEMFYRTSVSDEPNDQEEQSPIASEEEPNDQAALSR
jgi:hypothetical protein